MAGTAHAKCVGRAMKGFEGSAAARRAKFGRESKRCAGEHGHGRTRSGKRRSRKGGR